MRLVAVSSEDLTRDNDPERCTPFSHRPYFDRGCMSPQQKTILEVEGVLHIPGRVVGWDVQPFEVMKVILDFRPIGDRETHRGEYVYCLLRYLGYRMESAPGSSPSGKSYIQPLFCFPSRHFKSG